jgi:hypothetical protein
MALTEIDARYGYQMTGNGRWISLTLRKQKQKGKKPQITQKKLQKDGSDTDMDEPDQVGNLLSPAVGAVFTC